MKKKMFLPVCAIMLTFVLLFSGCSVDLQRFENAESRQYAETMLDALIANDPQAAYSIVSKICTEEEFKAMFTEMQSIIGKAESYELKLLSIHKNTNITNGQKTVTTRSVYEMTTELGRTIVSINMDNQVGVTFFNLTAYEHSDYYFTGTLGHMKKASGVQWALLLFNVLPVALSVYALIDCLRKKFKKKWLWILFLILGYFSLSLTLSPTKFSINYNVGSVMAYTALIRYGSGALIIRLMLPLGAILYFATAKERTSEAAHSDIPAGAAMPTSEMRNNIPTATESKDTQCS